MFSIIWHSQQVGDVWKFDVALFSPWNLPLKWLVCLWKTLYTLNKWRLKNIMTSPFNIMDLFKWFFKLEYYVYKLVALQLNITSQEFIFDLCLVSINCFFPHLLTFQEDYNLNVIINDILLQDLRHGNSICMLGQIQLHFKMFIYPLLDSTTFLFHILLLHSWILIIPFMLYAFENQNFLYSQ